MRYTKLNIAKGMVICIAVIIVTTTLFSLLAPESWLPAYGLIFALAVIGILVVVNSLHILQYRERKRVVDAGVEAEAAVIEMEEMGQRMGRG